MAALSPTGCKKPLTEGCGLGHACPSAQQPWGRQLRSEAPGLGFWSESQVLLSLPAPGGEAQTSPVSWCRLRGRLFRASSEV